MLAAIEARAVDVLVADDLPQISRDHVAFRLVLERAQAAGVAFHTVKHGAVDRLQAQFWAIFAQVQFEETSRRIKRGKRAAAERRAHELDGRGV